MIKIIGNIVHIAEPKTGSKPVGKFMQEWRKQEIVISEYGNPGNKLQLVCWNSTASKLGVHFHIGNVVEVEYVTKSYQPNKEEEKYYTNATALHIEHFLTASGKNNRDLIKNIEGMLHNLNHLIAPVSFGEEADAREMAKLMFYSLKDIIKIINLPEEYLKNISEDIKSIQSMLNADMGISRDTITS